MHVCNVSDRERRSGSPGAVNVSGENEDKVEGEEEQAPFMWK